MDTGFNRKGTFYLKVIRHLHTITCNRVNIRWKEVSKFAGVRIIHFKIRTESVAINANQIAFFFATGPGQVLESIILTPENLLLVYTEKILSHTAIQRPSESGTERCNISGRKIL